MGAGSLGALKGSPSAAGESVSGDSFLFDTAGSGAGAKLPMNSQSVSAVAEKYGIDLSDLNITINKARAGFYGVTSPSGAITLTRDAFTNEEQLARTLVHEQFHVQQIASGMGYPSSIAAGAAWEDEAYQYENDWWAAHGGG